MNFIDIATKVMLGVDPEVPHKSAFELDYVGIRAPQFSFCAFAESRPGARRRDGVDRRGGLPRRRFPRGDPQSDAVGRLYDSEKNILLSTGDSRSKMDMLSAAKALQAKGYDIFLRAERPSSSKRTAYTPRCCTGPIRTNSPTRLLISRKKKIDLVVNIPKNLSKDELNNDYTIRRSAIDFNIPLITNARLASAFINAFCRLSKDDADQKLERILPGTFRIHSPNAGTIVIPAFLLIFVFLP